MTPGTVVAIYDFTQNYSTVLQNEIKSAHYCKAQITLHPILCYIFNENNELTRESVVILSDDINHDYWAVDAFRRKLICHLHSKNVKISHLIEGCDGAGKQYKSVFAFHNLASASAELGILITRYFFGSEHGKGESDGESGLVKSKVAEYALRPNSNVQNASDIKRFGDEHLTKNSISKLKKRADEVIAERSFHVVNQIYRPAQRDELETIKRSMKFHAIASCNQKGCIMSRNLACFCNACVKDEKEKCVNSKYVQD